MRRRAGLGQAVALSERDAEAGVDGFDEVFCEGRGARVEHADRAEVVVGDDGVFAQEQDDGRDDVGEGDFVVLDGFAEVFDVEFGHDNEGEAVVEAGVEETCEAWHH